MHTLHTTDAYVVGAMPHGESNRVYRLVSNKLGYVYAHAQGVRELKNRNRYALASRGLINVSLVRGRDVWRITGARTTEYMYPPETRARQSLRRVLQVAGTFSPSEDPGAGVFAVVRVVHGALCTMPQRASEIETVGVIRILDRLGYVAHPGDDAVLEQIATRTDVLDEEVCATAATERLRLVDIINTALTHAAV